MKQLLLLILPLLSLNAFAQQSKNYKQWHETGLYKYDNMYPNTLIKRTKHRQIEYHTNEKYKLILKIEWVSDQEYHLTHIKSINAPGCLTKGEKIRAKIVTGNKDKYYAVYDSDSCGDGECGFIKVK